VKVKDPVSRFKEGTAQNGKDNSSHPPVNEVEISLMNLTVKQFNQSFRRGAADNTTMSQGVLDRPGSTCLQERRVRTSLVGGRNHLLSLGQQPHRLS
jgi:hypothetical protein